jgi:hypothetical protein
MASCWVWELANSNSRDSLEQKPNLGNLARQNLRISSFSFKGISGIGSHRLTSASLWGPFKHRGIEFPDGMSSIIQMRRRSKDGSQTLLAVRRFGIQSIIRTIIWFAWGKVSSPGELQFFNLQQIQNEKRACFKTRSAIRLNTIEYRCQSRQSSFDRKVYKHGETVLNHLMFAAWFKFNYVDIRETEVIKVKNQRSVEKSDCLKGISHETFPINDSQFRAYSKWHAIELLW